jgi:hypothetical protein
MVTNVVHKSYIWQKIRPRRTSGVTGGPKRVFWRRPGVELEAGDEWKSVVDGLEGVRGVGATSRLANTRR